MHSINIENLTFVYHRRNKEDICANDSVTLHVAQGEVYGLLGHNGAGKSTLLLQIMGLLLPTSGQIAVEGIDAIKHPQKVKEVVGYLPQGQTPLRYVELKNALYFAGRLKGASKVDAQVQVAYLLEYLELTQHADQFVNNLSGGLMRICNFAMSLMGNPELLILDEPTNNLDPHLRRKMWQLLAELNHKNGLTVLLVTHNLAEAERVMQRAAIMQKGKIIAQGSIGAIKQQFNQEILFEVWLKDMLELPEIVQSNINGRVERVRDGQFRIYLDKNTAQDTINVFIHHIGFDAMEDFHIAPLSLEETYHKI